MPQISMIAMIVICSESGGVISLSIRANHAIKFRLLNSSRLTWTLEFFTTHELLINLFGWCRIHYAAYCIWYTVYHIQYKLTNRILSDSAVNLFSCLNRILKGLIKTMAWIFYWPVNRKHCITIIETHWVLVNKQTV